MARAIGVLVLAMTGVAAAAQSPAKTDGMGKLDIMLMKPTAVKMGDNQFEVMVKDAAGKPITKADVSLLFVMPAMPAMKMAEMRNTVKLKEMGDGMYAGQGKVMVTGVWNVTIDVMQSGKSVGQKKVTVTAK
jgi:nitrogen fixation protein FixH